MDSAEQILKRINSGPVFHVVLGYPKARFTSTAYMIRVSAGVHRPMLERETRVLP